eukprot:186479-Amphidinium_carterae.3
MFCSFTFCPAPQILIAATVNSACTDLSVRMHALFIKPLCAVPYVDISNIPGPVLGAHCTQAHCCSTVS